MNIRRARWARPLSFAGVLIAGLSCADYDGVGVPDTGGVSDAGTPPTGAVDSSAHPGGDASEPPPPEASVPQCPQDGVRLATDIPLDQLATFDDDARYFFRTTTDAVGDTTEQIVKRPFDGSPETTATETSLRKQLVRFGAVLFSLDQGRAGRRYDQGLRLTGGSILQYENDFGGSFSGDTIYWVNPSTAPTAVDSRTAEHGAGDEQPSVSFAMAAGARGLCWIETVSGGQRVACGRWSATTGWVIAPLPAVLARSVAVVSPFVVGNVMLYRAGANLAQLRFTVGGSSPEVAGPDRGDVAALHDGPVTLRTAASTHRASGAGYEVVARDAAGCDTLVHVGLDGTGDRLVARLGSGVQHVFFTASATYVVQGAANDTATLWRLPQLD